MTVAIVWSEYSFGDHRIVCPGCGTNPRKKDMGLTILAPNHGLAHCFRCGLILSKRDERELSEAERKAYQCRMDALRKQHNAEKKERQAWAVATANLQWDSAFPATEHAYLSSKGVKAHGLRVDAARKLLIPIRDAKGALYSLQSIAPDGVKRFLPGGRVQGCYHSIGRPSGRIVVAEGYATGATIHEETGSAVAVAFNSGNLLSVSKALRSKYPCIDLVIAADDDWNTPGNPGMTAATEAARAVGGLLAAPNFAGLDRGARDTDFNDLARLAGRVEVNL